MSNEDMVCTSCQKPKASLTALPSKLIANKTVYLCKDCETRGYEPRWIVVLATRWHGAGTTSDYLRHHKYVGETITARELI